MEFINEENALNGLSDLVVRSGVCLFNAIKYIYSIAEEDFYKVSIRDALRIVLNNITDTDCLKLLGLKIGKEGCREMMTEEYNKILPIIVYSFAVRLPLLRNVRSDDERMSEEQIRRVYDLVIEKGAENIDDTIKESYSEYRYLVRKGKDIPSYTAEWYKSFIYSHVPKLAEPTNKNMFLLGFVDVLFAMFWTCLEDKLSNKIMEYCARPHSSPVDI